MAYPRACWLIYALGGGFGHLTRACALARAAAETARVRILTNSPHTGCVQAAMPELEIVKCDSRAAQQIEQARPDCLVVDTFPRGLVGELVDVLPRFSGLKVVLQRDLNPQYRAAYEIDRFIAEHYDLALDPGEVTGAPWLIRPADELPAPDRARRVLRLDRHKPCIIVCAAGNADELAWYGSVTRGLAHVPDVDVRCIAPICPPDCPPECWISYWPAIDLYSAADIVVGGGGYNTVYECLACQVPLIARPWPRKYDRQRLRAMRAGVRGSVTIVEDAVDAVAAAARATRRCASLPAYRNGSVDAAALIRRHLPPQHV